MTHPTMNKTVTTTKWHCSFFDSPRIPWLALWVSRKVSNLARNSWIWELTDPNHMIVLGSDHVSRHPSVSHLMNVLSVAIIRSIQFTERLSSYASLFRIPSGPPKITTWWFLIKLFSFAAWIGQDAVSQRVITWLVLIFHLFTHNFNVFKRWRISVT